MKLDLILKTILSSALLKSNLMTPGKLAHCIWYQNYCLRKKHSIYLFLLIQQHAFWIQNYCRGCQWKGIQILSTSFTKCSESSFYGSLFFAMTTCFCNFTIINNWHNFCFSHYFYLNFYFVYLLSAALNWLYSELFKVCSSINFFSRNTQFNWNIWGQSHKSILVKIYSHFFVSYTL
jgi:hypothetical protein